MEWTGLTGASQTIFKVPILYNQPKCAMYQTTRGGPVVLCDLKHASGRPSWSWKAQEEEASRPNEIKVLHIISQ